MEFLEGETLQSLLTSSGPLGLSASVDYILEAGEALAEAHAAILSERARRDALAAVTSLYEYHGGFRLRTLSA